RKPLFCPSETQTPGCSTSRRFSFAATTRTTSFAGDGYRSLLLQVFAEERRADFHRVLYGRLRAQRLLKGLPPRIAQGQAQQHKRGEATLKKMGLVFVNLAFAGALARGAAAHDGVRLFHGDDRV